MTKIKGTIIFILLFLLSIMITSCNDNMANLQEIDNSLTRSNSTEIYYWYHGEKIFLKESDEKAVVYETNDNQQTLSAKSSDINKLSLSPQIIKHKDYEEKDIRWAVIKKDITMTLSYPNILPVFLTENGEEIYLGVIFYVKLHKEEDLPLLEKLAEEYNVNIVGHNSYMPLWYTLLCDKDSHGNALTIANEFYETGLFEHSEPDLMHAYYTTSNNNPLYNTQWGLNNTGQNNGTPGIDIKLEQAKAITQGDKNIVVAIIDHGIDLTHPDLTNTYTHNYDTETGVSYSVLRGPHGTACAGIIGAQDNNIGIIGIAPKCPLMSISNNLIVSTDVSQKLADGFNFAWTHSASIISNSWHSPVSHAILEDAIQTALTKGRNGLGCVVVFAAGNNNTSRVSYPARAIPNIITVGAINPRGERKSKSSYDGENWGSNYGTELDVVAPGIFIATTDLTNTRGYSSTDYTTNFNGTSSACPHVAGIAALILSVNPTLSVNQVENIITSTAQKIGSYHYDDNGKNEEMGYGLCNAYTAIKKALNLNTDIEHLIIKKDTTFYGEDISVTDMTVK